MKLSHIEEKQILLAAVQMDAEKYSGWSKYWVQLPTGKEYQFKNLIQRANRIATGKEIDNNFFQSNSGYRKYIEQKFGFKVIFKIPNNISFFTKNDFAFFKLYGGKKYRKDNIKDINAGKKIKNEIFDKTNIWARILELNGWEIEIDNRWQLSGTFKPYSWVKIYKKGDKKRKIFFTIGVDSNRDALIYKLDCQRSQYNKNNALSKDQVNAFDRIVRGSSAVWNEITLNQLIDYDWESLQELTEDFIYHYEFLYDEIILAFENASVVANNTHNLLEEITPSNLFNELPPKKYSFKGVVIDYDSENKFKSKIGLAGEELVIVLEKNHLVKNGFKNLADEVVKVKDGEGYDILSFDLNGEEKYIEVKTTTGSGSRPFIMTDNEWEFMSQNSNRYCVYRIYDFDLKNNIGKVFILKGALNNKVFIRPKQLEIFVKNDFDI